ncbi:MAG TPA: hypothetical protein VH835_03220 [Dongiaceae bacterium]|jgi:hypothetical protein
MEIMLALWLACAIGTMLIARSKGHSMILWFIVGFFFGILGLIVSLFLSNRNTADLKYF